MGNVVKHSVGTNRDTNRLKPGSKICWIISELGNEHYIETMVKRLTRKSVLSPNHEDLCQDLYLNLLTNPETERLYEEGVLKKYITSMIKKNLYSYTSQYFRKYERHSQMQMELKEEILDISDIPTINGKHILWT